LGEYFPEPRTRGSTVYNVKGRSRVRRNCSCVARSSALISTSFCREKFAVWHGSRRVLGFRVQSGLQRYGKKTGNLEPLSERFMDEFAPPVPDSRSGLEMGESTAKGASNAWLSYLSSFSLATWSLTDLKKSVLSIRPASERTASRSIFNLACVTLRRLNAKNTATSSRATRAAIIPK